MRENAAALATLREGFQHLYRQPPARNMITTFPYYAQYRSLTCLLVAESQVKEGQGDWGGAMTSSLEALKIGYDMPRGAPVLGGLVGIACQAIARGEIWPLMAHLDAPQAKTALERLQSLSEPRVTLADILITEKEILLGTLEEVLAHPEKYREPTEDAEDVSTEMVELAMKSRPVLESIKRTHATWMDAWIAAMRQPYRRDIKYPQQAAESPAAKQFLEQFVDIFTKMHFRWTDNETQNRLLLVTLALHAYRQEHGQYPAQLAELAPTYLRAVPGDPYHADAPFGYRLAEKSYLLYSVGPDGRDDHGKAIQNPNGKGNPIPVSVNATGDVVVGVNSY